MAAPVKFLMVIQLMFFLQLFCFTNGVKQKHVSISLNAKWRSTPMLLEASEFVAKESEEKFWNFIEDFSELSEQDVDTYTDEAFYKLIQKFAARFLSQMQVELLRFALSLRAYSPRVAMYNQIAKDYKDQFGVCEAFVDIHGEMTCDPEKVEQLVDSAATRPKSTTFKFDHSFPGSHSNEVTVILFAEVGRKTFTEFHSKLKTLAGQGQVQYIFRHYIQSPPDNNVRLAGYGIELAIKSTEYKAKDDTKVEDGGKSDDDDDNDQDEDIQGFVFSTLKKLHPDSTEDLMKFKTHLVDSSTEVEPLKVWQFQDLSFQTAQRVLSASSDDALKVLTDIIQNFPVKTRSLVNVQVDSKVKQEIQKNQKHMQSTLEVGNGESALFVNGWQIDLEVMDMFLLLDLMGSEAKLIDGLHAIGVQGEALTKMLSLDLKDSEEYVLDFRHDSVIWINDLENDQKYSRWPDQVEDLLRPTWPGMMRHVAKNFFHLVLYVNPADPSSIPLLKMVESFYVHNAPVRIGIVLIATSGEEVDYTKDVSVALYRAFHFIEDAHTAYKAVSFLTDVYDRADGGDITPELVLTVFKEKFSSLGSSVDTILGSGTEYDEQREETIEYFEGTGLGELPQALINGLPIKKSVLNAEDFEENVVSTIMQVTPPVQRDVYHGKIHDRMNILDYLMGQDNALSRLNSRVLSAATNATYLSFTEESAGTLNIEPEADMSNDEVTARISVNMKYLAKKEEDSVRPLTVWLVGDLNTEDGRSLLYAAIKNLRSTSDMRLGFVHNPKTVSENKDDHLIPLAIQAAFQSQPMNLAKLFITKLLKEENVAALTDKSKTLSDLEVNGMDMAVYLKALDDQDLNFLRWGQTFSQRVLRFRPGNRGIISNGRVLGPLRPDESFLTEDFNLLDQYAVKKSAGKVRDTLRSSKLKPNEASDLIMKVCALLESQVSGESAGRKSVSFPSEKYSVVNLPGKSDQPAHDIVAILDPLTRAAQKLVPLLMVLKEVTNSNLKVVFNCKDKLSEMPLKSFYRLVLEPEPQFRVDGSLSSGPSARFTNLPQKPILTLNMDSPDSWMVEVVRAAYDLDNIVMEEVETGVNAEFELEHILLEGHCYDSSSGQPPRGLQFTLGTSTNPAMVDTIVMANLGYFQLKANPGAWLLDLREGRSAEFYDISSHDNTESTTNDRPLTVVIDSFRGKTVKIQVKKKPEKANEDLLGEEDESKSMWDSLSSTFTGGDEAKEDKDETLNIFSLASGHLYERFLRIMMLSVIKNSQSKVKFWFLKNYLSPSFKDFIPHYAKKYGFEYELVQYKWPRWLHQQTEKQRMIWGYKILFLDVLFPLHVKKIIFVDADQTVRADLQELYDLDLGGAPYGYTPFCDSREDMDGFRFWKSGYWNNHLAGRKYHISALYVVDLKKFRRIAAGDRLRGQYQGLSQDPNSLSNLDQDLPNNMIHQVSIKSLPQEWLWCETWCDDRSKKKAKTIDLCNNPKTKEPKLQAAERIVGEWKDYDNEIKQLWETFHQTSSTKSAQTTETSTEKRDEL